MRQGPFVRASAEVAVPDRGSTAVVFFSDIGGVHDGKGFRPPPAAQARGKLHSLARHYRIVKRP